ncbi:MAG: pyridoxal-dependent decarboxylase [Bacteroidales bacterium]
MKEINPEFSLILRKIEDYLANIESYPVKSTLSPGKVLEQLPEAPPEAEELFEQVMTDFDKIILPGMTHWQSPSFFAYFPANSSLPSLLAEMLTAALGAQCMSWETSPAATELEERMMEWLRQMTGLPQQFTGVIQDTASSATLTALITARERATKWQINQKGFSHNRFRIYCSSEAHSSVDKAVRIAGFGVENLVKVPVDNGYRMDVVHLQRIIEKDLKNGFVPLAIVATLGTTGTTSIDPLREIAHVADRYNLWLHVDAAFAGSALILEEYRWMIQGIERVDSFVFNPHKWLFTNFDCSAYFVRDRNSLIKTFGINPEYLKTAPDKQVNNYRDWGIPLGRRFRALKLWFVIRMFGVSGLQNKIRQHIRHAMWVEDQIRHHPGFELMAPRTMSLVCFRYHPEKTDNPERLNEINQRLLRALNESGKVYLSHTLLKGNYTLRMVTAQTNVERHHVEKAWKIISETAAAL